MLRKVRLNIPHDDGDTTATTAGKVVERLAGHMSGKYGNVEKNMFKHVYRSSIREEMGACFGKI